MRLSASSGPPCPLLPLPGNSRYKLTSVDVPDMVSYPLPQSSSSYSGHAPSSVAMVSGLHPSKMNCTRIFNLFCLYGNIEKVGGGGACVYFHEVGLLMILLFLLSCNCCNHQRLCRTTLNQYITLGFISPLDFIHRMGTLILFISLKDLLTEA